MSAVMMLVRRDVLRFVRQPTRVVAAVGTAGLMWLVLGSGFAHSFKADASIMPEGVNSYAAYLAPGMATMIVIFSSIFAAIALIEDRQTGFLQAVMVSPTPTSERLGARLFSCVMLSVAQALPIVLAGGLVGLSWGPMSILGAIVALSMVSAGIAGIGLAMAWKVNSIQGFHGVMNLLILPMWLLSGAFFPADRSSAWISVIVRLNPMSWATSALRASLAGDPLQAGWNWLGAAAFAAVGIGVAAYMMRRR